MNLSNLILYKEQYDDIRFGPVDIYQDKETNEINMVKSVQFQSEQEFQNHSVFYKTWRKFKNPYIWEMLDLFIDQDSLTISSRFLYPNEDLFQYQEALQRPEVLTQFVTDSLKALCVLEKNQFIMGALRPENFFFSKKKNSFVLIDWIFDAGTYYQNVIIDCMLKGELIYISPELFRAIFKKQQILDSVYQQDVFSLGMVIASVLLQDEEIAQSVYDI